MEKKDKNGSSKKSKVQNIILKIIIVICAVLLLMPMSTPVKADVKNNAVAENEQKNDAMEEDKAARDLAKQLLVNGKWAAYIPGQPLKFTNETITDWGDRLLSYTIMVYPDFGLIQEKAIVYDETIGKTVKYIRMTSMNIYGDTLTIGKLNEKPDVAPVTNKKDGSQPQDSPQQDVDKVEEK